MSRTTETPEHISWRAMRERCNNPNHMYYAEYGGRGIAVCQRWETFAAFFADMGPRPEGTTLDRIDVNGDYEPGNVRWALAKTQRANRRPRRPRTHCSKGHALTPENTRFKKRNEVVCITCAKEYQTAYARPEVEGKSLMTTTTAIPCKRPKVTLDPRDTGLGAVDANCHVPGCSWTYPADKEFMALKSDAEWQATRHRGEHRAAVPDTAILLAHNGHQAECDCGEKWIAPTKAHARTWLRHHLELDHGLVECP